MRRNAIFLAGFLALAITLMATARLLFGWSTLAQAIAFGAVVAVAWIARHVNNRLLRRRYPSWSSAAFLAGLGDFGDLSAEDVLRARGQIARELGVNPAMLAPQLTLIEMARDLDFLGSSSIGMDNIEALVGVHDEGGPQMGAAVGQMSVGEVAVAIARNRQTGNEQKLNGPLT